MKPFEKIFPFLLVVGILLNFNALLLPILEPDGALYATIAKHIALTNDWVNLWGDGHDWLDKPHLPFWLCAASFKVFGINAFAYKLPAFLFWLGGIYFTYLLAEIFYNKYTAKVAAVLYVFALHGVLNNFDVRAEPFLATLSIGAIYFFFKAYVSGKWLYVILVAFFCGCAVMTKGIFVLATIGGGFVIWWMITKQWKQFANYRWYVMLVLIFIFISPELYCLYAQFDLHPEKVVFGQTHVSGIHFFFWDSQFGRFFNTGPIKGKGDKTFFLHTTLWAYLPWSVVLCCAVVQLFRKGKLSADRNYNRWIIYGSAVVTFVLFSFSGFQLPHYIAILFPQFSIVVAAYFTSLKKEKTLRSIQWLQVVLLLLAVVAVCLLSWYGQMGYSIVAIIIVLLIAAAAIFYQQKGVAKIAALGAALSMVVIFWMFNFFYPALLQYQCGMAAGKQLQQTKTNTPIAILGSSSYAFEFYAPGIVAVLNDEAAIDIFMQKQHTIFLYASEPEANSLTAKGYSVQWFGRYNYFHITMLDKDFINPKTRPTQTQTMCLVQIKKPT